ncbi:MAG: M48 family metallopeptidase [Chitinophagaceae bacterium]
MKQVLQYGRERIELNITYADRKTLGITVTPGMEVLIKAPDSVPMDQLLARVQKKAAWICRQIRFFQTFHPKPAPKEFRGGETHYFMGRQFILRVSTGKKEAIHFDGRQIFITARNKTRVKNVLMDWYKLRAREKFVEIAAPVIERFTRYKVAPAGIYVQDMQSRWGSCTPSGRILLNTNLILAPKACIEYVIVHELCHLVHRNHSRKFIALLTKEMPDWEKRKQKLEHFVF